MAEKVEQPQQINNNQNDGRKIRKSPDYQSNLNSVPGAITRERSFVRTSNQQNINKRRSLAFTEGNQRGKPAMVIYRPPNVRSETGAAHAMNKLNVHAQEFTMMPTDTRSTPPGETRSFRSSMIFPNSGGGGIGAAGSPTGLISQQQFQYVASANSGIVNRRQAGLSMGGMPLNSFNAKGAHNFGHRSILVSHPISGTMPLLNSPSSGNILHTTNVNRVKFAAEPQKPNHNKLHNYHQLHHVNNMNQTYVNGGIINDPYINISSPLQRSKSLSSADALTRGIAGLGLGLGNDVTDIGQFPPEVQALIDSALDDPNKLNSRSLMELTSHFIKRAIEGRRFALPISRLCLTIIAKEQKETFLEALLNTCRQWYQEREKLLFDIQGMKSPSRVRFTAFMAFLTEMFCQLKRRQLQLRTQCEGAPPPLVLLTLLSKCCEDAVIPPVRSLSEIECLFYVLTCIGRDIELQLPQQLELIMSMVRDAFLNAKDSAPAIRRTLLQLIELKASHWQLPGNTVLYYYPTTK